MYFFFFSCRKELSTDQVEKPVNLEALTSWADAYPADVRRDIDMLAPMLQTLGYDTKGWPPNYGEPDKMVKENSARVHHEKQMNKLRAHRKDANADTYRDARVKPGDRVVAGDQNGGPLVVEHNDGDNQQIGPGAQRKKPQPHEYHFKRWWAEALLFLGHIMCVFIKMRHIRACFAMYASLKSKVY